MDAAVTGGLFAIGGVVLGVGLTAAIQEWTRKRVSDEQREQARHARELVAAEHLDEALILASAALDLNTSRPLEARYLAAHEACTAGRVTYSPRIRDDFVAVAEFALDTLLAEVVSGTRTAQELPRRIVWQVIANARATLAHFLRGDLLPASAFPDPEELRSLLGEGDSLSEQGEGADPFGPLKEWLRARPQPDFHEADRPRRASLD